MLSVVNRHPRVLIAEGTLGKALEDPIRTFEGLSGDVHCLNDFPGDQSTRILLPIRWMAGGQAFPGPSLRVQLSRHLARCFPRPRGAGGLELAPVVARASVWLALILPTSSCITIQPTGICSATKTKIVFKRMGCPHVLGKRNMNGSVDLLPLQLLITNSGIYDGYHQMVFTIHICIYDGIYHQ